MRSLDTRRLRRTCDAAAHIRQDLAYTTARLHKLDRELGAVKNGTHQAVLTVMRQVQSREGTVGRTAAVNTAARYGGLLR